MKISLNDYIVITSVNRNYLHLFQVWLEYFRSNGPVSRLRIITFDRESDAFINNLGLVSINLGEDVTTPGQIYSDRLDAIACFLEQGMHIIHSDADALWLSPAIPSLIDQQYDLQISIGYGVPVAAFRQWGFTLCCGFYVLHSSDRTRTFLQRWKKRSKEILHDQNALNLMLLDSNTQWEKDCSSANIGHNEAHELSIEAIPYHQVCREARRDLFIFHPYLPGHDESEKLLELTRRLDTIGEPAPSMHNQEISSWHHQALKSIQHVFLKNRNL